jgi:hypothetical protein
MRIQQFTLDESCSRKMNTKVTKEKAKGNQINDFFVPFFLISRDRVRFLERNIFVLNLRSLSRILLMRLALIEVSTRACGAG